MRKMHCIRLFRFSRALLLLRKKKMLESQLDKSENILENVERMVKNGNFPLNTFHFFWNVQTHDLEFAQVQVDVVHSLKQGNDALKKMNELLKLEDIEKLMEDSREAVEYQNVRNHRFAPFELFLSFNDVFLGSIESSIGRLKSR